MASLTTRLTGAWAQLLSVALGWWLMAAPAALGYGGFAADAHRVLGPIAAAFALVAVWGHVRGLRWANVLLGGLLVLSPLGVYTPLASTYGTVAAANGVVTGLALVALSFVQGEVYGAFGGGWWSLWTGEVAGTSGPDDRA